MSVISIATMTPLLTFGPRFESPDPNTYRIANCYLLAPQKEVKEGEEK